MTNTLRILLKPTGEYFNVPYEAQTNIHDLIKYVCTHTTVIPNTHPNYLEGEGEGEGEGKFIR